MKDTEVSLNARTDNDPSASFTDTFNQLDLPVLEYPEHAYGGTGYLDSLKSEDMSHSAMKGVDKWDRPFIAIRAEVTPCEEDGTPRRESREGVEVYFQRYDNDDRIWVSGGPLGLLISNMCVSDKQCLLELLQQKKTIIVRNDVYRGPSAGYGNSYKAVKLV